MYNVTITRHALKELLGLPARVSDQISKAIDNLEENPRPIGCKKLKGESEYLWRIRVGKYRVIYAIEDTIQIVEVRKIGHRKDIYE
jgi:mRNA interferase RelE/StbE